LLNFYKVVPSDIFEDIKKSDIFEDIKKSDILTSEGYHFYLVDIFLYFTSKNVRILMVQIFTPLVDLHCPGNISKITVVCDSLRICSPHVVI